MPTKSFFFVIAFLCFVSSGFGQTIVKNSFEETASDTWSPLTFSTVECTNGNDIWDYTSSLNSITPSDGLQFWGIQDLNGNCGGNSFETISLPNINISSFTNVIFKFDYKVIGYDNNDDIKYQLFYDNVPQAEVLIVDGSSNLTIGWITESVNIPSTVTNVKVIFSVKQNGDDYGGIDNVKLEGIANAVSTEVEFASATYSTNENSTSIDLCIDIVNPDASNPTTADVVLTSSSTLHITYSTTTVTFPAGSSAQQCVTIPIADNITCGDSTNYSFDLQSITGGNSAVVGTQNTTTLAVSDNDLTVSNAINEHFTSGLGTFTQVSETGTIAWTQSGTNAEINGYSSGNTNQKDWLIHTTPFNFNNLENELLTIDYSEAYTGNNVEVYYSTDFNGTFTSANTSIATWTLIGSLDEQSSSSSYGSGTKIFDLTSLTGSNIYIALLYTSTTSAAESWRIDQIILNTSQCTTPQPEIEVQGNSIEIVSGDITPSLSDNTNFGTSLVGNNLVQTFTILNTGTLDLLLPATSVVLLDGSTGFAVTQPLSTTITPGNSTTFTVTFNSPTIGSFSDTVLIDSNDSNESTYDFEIQATANNIPNIVLNSNNPATADGTIIQSENDNLIYQFDLSVTAFDAVFTDLSFTTSGTYAASNITNFKLWYDTSSTFNAASSSFLENLTTGLGTGLHTFTAFNQSIIDGATGYFFITTDIPCDATLGNTIIVDAITTANLTFTSANKSGTAFTGGTHTFQTATPNNVTGFTTSACENNSTTLDWTDPTNCFDNVLIFANNSSFTSAIPTGDSSLYAANATFGSGTAFDGGFCVYKGTANTETIIGLTNGTTYTYKIFTRNDLEWSSGIEVSCIPSVAYCTSSFTESDADAILNVQLNTLNNSSGDAQISDPNGYEDFTGITPTDLEEGSSYDLSITIDTNGNYTYDVWAFFDWDSDGDFDSAIDESYDLGDLTNVSNGALTTSVTVPLGATLGNTRMRIVIINDDTPVACDPQLWGYGETEDYTVNIISSCTPTHTISSFAPTAGPIGTEVTIIGSGFTSGSTVSFNGVSATILSQTATQLIVEVPNTTTGTISITESGCAISTASAYTFVGYSGSCSSTVFTDLIISEVYDSESANVWYMELYNPTNSDIDLDNASTDYSIDRYGDISSSTATRTIDLTGTILANSTFLLKLGTSSDTCSLTYDFIETGAGINTDDKMILVKNGIDVDRVDAPNNDGYTILRNTVASGPSATYNAADWTTNSLESCSELGSFIAPSSPPSISTQPLDVSTACSSSAVFSIAATAGNGGTLTYQWSFNDGSSTTWLIANSSNLPLTTVSGNTSNTLTLTGGVSAYSGYQFFCEVIEDASCSTASNAAQLRSISTTWDGTAWDNGAPSLSFAAIINGDYNTITNGSFSACSLIVNASNRLTVGNNSYVEIENDITVNGELYVETKGALVQNSDSSTFTVNTGGTALVNKTTTPLNSIYEYTYWSSPAANVMVQDGLAFANPSRRFWFNAANFLDVLFEINNTNTFIAGHDGQDDNGDDWVLISNGTDIMSPGLGYVSTHTPVGFTSGAQYTYTFEGPLNNGIINAPIAYNGANGDEDWNLIGNPYPCAIDADAFLTANASVIGGAAYLWSQNTPANGTSSGNQAQNFSESDYAMITNGSGNIAGGDMIIPNSFIPSGQSFFVQGLANGNAIFNNALRMADATSNSQFFRTSNTTNRLWLNLTSDNGVFNQILVAYVNGATDLRDNMSYDALRSIYNDNASMIYTTIENETDKFAIQGKAPETLTLDEVVPLGFQTVITVPTLYSLSIAQMEGTFLAENTVYLKDILLNVYHDLSTSAYTFTSEVGDFQDRFEIVFQTNNLSIDNFNSNENAITIIELQNDDVKFTVPSNLTIKSVKIYDALGRALYDFKGSKNVEIYNLSNLSNAAYIAQIELSNGNVVSKKAIKK